MNEYNQRMAAIRRQKEEIEKVLPSITNPDVKQSLTNQKNELEEELKKMLKEKL